MLETYFSTARRVITSRSAIPGLEVPGGHQLEHLTLAGGEPGQRVIAAPAPEQRRDDLRIDRGSAAGDPSYGVDELADIADPILQQVSDPFRRLRRAAAWPGRARRTATAPGPRRRDGAGGCAGPLACPRRCGVGGSRMSTITMSGGRLGPRSADRRRCRTPPRRPGRRRARMRVSPPAAARCPRRSRPSAAVMDTGSPPRRGSAAGGRTCEATAESLHPIRQSAQAGSRRRVGAADSVIG